MKKGLLVISLTCALTIGFSMTSNAAETKNIMSVSEVKIENNINEDERLLDFTGKKRLATTLYIYNQKHKTEIEEMVEEPEIPQEEIEEENVNSITEAQQKIIDTAYKTEFVEDGLCAVWISKVFENAGYGYPTGNANSFKMSHEEGEIKPGMVIAVEHSGPAESSYNYGHIGLYLGDGLVMDNCAEVCANQENGCTVSTLEQWKRTYEYECESYWGWVFGNDLSAK